MAESNENNLSAEDQLLKTIKEQNEEQLTGFATKESIAELIAKMDAFENDYQAKDEVTQMRKGLEELVVRINALSEKGGEGQQNDEGAIAKFMKRDSLAANLKAKKGGYEALAVKAAALMTTGNVKPVTGGAFNQLFGNYIDPTIHSAPKPENFILPLITVKEAAGTENIWYTDRVNEEGDAQFIGEGNLKPLIDAEWQQGKADVKEVAEFWKMSNRLIMHAPSVVSDFKEHADELIENKIDEGVLIGDGTGDNLEGITTAAGAFVAPAQLANYYEEANIFDVVMAMATAVRLQNYKGQITAVLNTVWEAKMQGIKNADGDYIMPNFVAPDGRKIGSTNIVFSNRMPDANILVGDLKKFCAVIAEDVTYYEGWEDQDFRKNLSSRKLEAFMGTYLPQSNAAAILYDDISTVQTAIAVAPPAP